MIRFPLIATALAAAFAAGPARAQTNPSPFDDFCVALACSDIEIERVLVFAEGDAQIETSGDETALSCSPVLGVRATIRREDENFDALLNFFMTVQTRRERLVQVRFQRGETGCVVSSATRSVTGFPQDEEETADAGATDDMTGADDMSGSGGT